MSATNRGKEREVNDNYPTEGWLTASVLPILEKRLIEIGVPAPKVYEPAAGELQAIVKELTKAWPNADVEYSDIIDGVDFLTEPPEPIFDLIISNPPYKYAMQFIERAMLWRRTEQSLVVMLLRLNFLGSKKRAAWMRANKPSLAVTPKRPSFGKNKHGKRGTDATEYAWFIWPYDEPYLSILETENIREARNVRK